MGKLASDMLFFTTDRETWEERGTHRVLFFYWGGECGMFLGAKSCFGGTVMV